MIEKTILPESVDFGVPSVEMIGVGSRGMDKTAMEKRSRAFDDVIPTLRPDSHKAYLHVISVGAYEWYGPNRNSDAWNEYAHEITVPYPEPGAPEKFMLDGGLSKYHDKTYMDGAHVYQEHKVENTDPSGEIVAARYNYDMHRGELIIAVDTEKWAPRLQRKARGENIYLSIGASVNRDLCLCCGREAHVASEHCTHFRNHRNELTDAGVRCCVMNDKPKFYDISGVNVPADKIAFVLREIDAGGMPKTASLDVATRRPMLHTKAARLLGKLAAMEKALDGTAFETGVRELDGQPPEDVKERFCTRVQNWPADEVLDCCSRKGVLLTPDMLFRVIGAECPDEAARELLTHLGPDCCGAGTYIVRELQESPECNDELMDGSFDGRFIPDISLDGVVDEFAPELSVRPDAVTTRIIRVTVRGGIPVKTEQIMMKSASLSKEATAALRRTYARYLVSFAAQNDDATCRNALRRVAAL